MCRDITKNSLKVKPGHHSAATCQAAWRNGTWYRLADCWDSQMTGEEKANCAKSPIDLVPEKTLSAVGGSLSFNMAPVKSVTVTPSNYTLDALPNVFAVPGAITNFGSMVVNGRSFLMHKISVKPISSHKYNGKHYAAELQVEGIMDGDGFNKLAELSGVHAGGDAGHSSGDHGGHGGESHGSGDAGHSAGGDSHDSGSSGGHADGHSDGHGTDGSFSTDIGHGTVDHHDDHDAGDHGGHDDHNAGDHGGHGGGHRRLQAAVEVFHRVILSVPIEIGKENSLLRELGLPFDAYKDSISAMHPYQIENTVNLKSALSKALDGPWMWYRGGMVTPGCPDWGVRWLMLMTPLQASFLQLNFLDMKVSGMDSTRVFPVEMDDATYK
ncbi:CA14, partial [Symbiodinium sp. CCMP2456]